MQRNNDNSASTGKSKPSGFSAARSEEQASGSIAIDIPQISLPKGGGALKGIDEKFQVNAANGTASFSLPLPFSPGRNGFMPAIALGYNSGAGNGLFGLGWDLGFPSIQRKTDKRLPRYRDSEESDTFMFSGVEDLVPFVEKVPADEKPDNPEYEITRYRPRIEGGFSRIGKISHPAHGMWWKVTTRDNIVTFFGKSPEYRITDPADQNRIFQWLPELSFDDKGNCVLYEFKAEDGKGYGDALQDQNRFDANGAPRFVNRYLKRVYYTNQTSFIPDHNYSPQNPLTSDFLMEMVLDYGEHGYLPTDIQGTASVNYTEINPWSIRHDAFSNYRSGFEIRTARLCRRLLMFHHFEELGGGPCLVRSLDLEYRGSSLEVAPEQGKKLEVTYLVSAIQRSYFRGDNSYRFKSLPPVEFEYQELCWSRDIHSVAPEDAVNAPAGLSSGYQWVDLYNEGIAGILTEQGNGWFYKENLGNGHFTIAKPVIPKPSFLGISSGVLQLQDLEADGRKQVVINSRGLNGYFELKEDNDWENFRAFEQIPNVNLRDPNTRLLDLNGDGQPEIVITEENVFTWYPSAGTLGYDAPELAPKPFDEEQGPAIVFADSTQSIFLADMSGDGLTDIVRIRNGQVCYWPNLGYGRFGAKVSMSDAPWFDHPDQFNPAYLQLADISGTGATDIIYLGKNQFLAWLNLSGNAWSESCDISPFPDTAQPNAVTVADLLGNGTSCIVWSSPLPGNAQAPLRYIDLMSGQKPHVLNRYKNNFGKETVWTYKSSTHYYLEDKKAGKPWITKLPFPVQVVSQVTVTDKWRQSSFANTYSYHHGYYDHAEREFRGFGRVEQVDVEDFGKFIEGNIDSPYITNDQTLYQPPVKTLTWFHTGAFMGRERILSQFREEYFQPEIEDFKELELPDPDIESENLSADEWREALRACKGMTLRQEVYELDVDALQQGEQRPVKLFSTAFHNCWIRCLQPKGQNQHAVFLVGESEAITYQYELDLRAFASESEDDPKVLDPRIAHTLNLNFDQYGQPLQSVAVAYARNQSAIAKMKDGEAKEFIQRSGIQSTHHIAYTENRYTIELIEQTEKPYYRLPLPYEVLTYELTGFKPEKKPPYFGLKDFKNFRLSKEYQPKPPEGAPDPFLGVTDLGYHERPNPEKEEKQKRLVEQVRVLYFANDLNTPLSLGSLDSLALPYETYKLALTNDLLSAILGDKLPSLKAAGEVYGDMLQRVLGEGGYRQFDDEPGLWWIRSGIAGFAEDAVDHFYLPERYTDPFGNVTTLTFDNHDLYIKESTDPANNTVSVTNFDYRVLAPLEMQDVNGNLSEVAFDILGVPAAVAVKGKNNEGDNLKDLPLELEEAELRAFFTGEYDEAQARTWLDNATARHIYYLGETIDSKGTIQYAQHPACAAGIVREKHVAQLAEGESSPLQAAFEYSDGMGAVLVKKVQAEPETMGGPLQWIASGKTVLNNKGKPVKQYEPYFSKDEDGRPNHRFEEPCEQGVTPILYYDAPGRQVRVEMPDGTLNRVEFSPWFMRTFDANDTILEPGNAWYDHHTDVKATPEMRRAAQLAAMHADTPAVVHLDSLGRDVLAIAHNRCPGEQGPWEDQKYLTYTHLDAEGKPLWVQDARGNYVMVYARVQNPADFRNMNAASDYVPAYDITGNLLFQHSNEAGDRWMLPDSTGQPMYVWDENEYAGALEQRLLRTEYDALRRPTRQWLRINSGDEMEIGRTVFGESLKDENGTVPPFVAANNLRGQALLMLGPEGCTQAVRFDFKGNLLESRRQLLADAEAHTVDWSSLLTDGVTSSHPISSPLLSTEVFTQSTQYDALNRMTRLENWHLEGRTPAIYTPTYNRRGALESETLSVRVQVTQAIRRIDYDAKGQRTRIQYGDPKGDILTTTRYDYDPHTFRLVQLRTTRHEYEPNPAFPAFRSNLKDEQVLQQLLYTYDPSGNITEIEDQAYEPVFFKNQQVEPRSQYEYDAQYQLISATGRENYLANGAPKGFGKVEEMPTQNFGASDKALRNYTQRYTYDSTGNFITMQHIAADGSWTRHYETEPHSNRLTRTWLGDDEVSAVNYRYDTHGSMLNFINVPTAQNNRWDYRDMIHTLNLEGGGQAYYQYDAEKQRTRKRIVHNNGEYWERIYLSGYELYRRYVGGDLNEETETHHLFTDEQRVLIVEDVIKPAEGQQEGVLYRYQYSNHLGSVGLECDTTGRIISYEEFHPYGTTAYQARNAAVQAAAKRYRYTGMERDEETGLAYHTARYYLGWLGRWGSCDPKSISGGINIYVYGRCSPPNYTDLLGTQCDPSSQSCFNYSTPVVQELDFSQSNLALSLNSEEESNNVQTSNSSTASTTLALSISTNRYLFGRAVAPVDMKGQRLTGTYYFWSGELDKVVAKARIWLNGGFLMSQTPQHFAAANQFANTLRQKAAIMFPGITFSDDQLFKMAGKQIFLPEAEKRLIWDPPSADVACRQVLAGQSVQGNLVTSPGAETVQARVEAPVTRSTGKLVGGVMGLEGVLNFWGGLQEEDRLHAALGITGGTIQIGGGALFAAGASSTSALAMSIGSKLSLAGSLITAPITLSHASEELQSENSGIVLQGMLRSLGIVFLPAGMLATFNDLFTKPAAEKATEISVGYMCSQLPILCGYY